MTLGIVIPVIDIDLHYLPKALEAIAAMDPQPDSVIVVHDGVEEVITPPGVRYHRLSDKPSGTGRAINYGISVTQTDWIMTHGADDTPKPWLVKRVMECNQSCDILAIAYNAITPSDATIRYVSPRRVDAERVSEGNIGIPEFSPFKRTVWERFPLDEDPDNHMDGALMYLQAILAGAKVGYIKEACLDFCVRPDSKWHRNSHKELELRANMLRKAGL